MILLFCVLALVFFALAALKVPEKDYLGWIGAGLFFLTLAIASPEIEVLLK